MPAASEKTSSKTKKKAGCANCNHARSFHPSDGGCQAFGCRVCSAWKDPK